MKFILYICTLIVVLSCSNETDPDALPSFKGIEANENTIFILDTDDNRSNRIYAVDTLQSKIMYTYDFKEIRISNIAFDMQLLKNLYICLNDGRVVELYLANGKTKEISIDYYVYFIELLDKQLWLVPDGFGAKNKPVKYYRYDPLLQKITSITIPEGGGMGGGVVTPSGQLLIDLFFDNINQPEIYNVSTMKIIDTSIINPSYKYFGYGLTNEFIMAAYFSDDGIRRILDIYKLNESNGLFSFSFLLTFNDTIGLIGVLSLDNKYYFIGKNGIHIRNEVFDTILTTTFDDIISNQYYLLNNYIWLPNPYKNGVYKINPDDLSIEVVK